METGDFLTTFEHCHSAVKELEASGLRQRHYLASTAAVVASEIDEKVTAHLETLETSFGNKEVEIISKRRFLQLYHFHEVPEYLKDNIYIRTGYRAFYSHYESWVSVFRVHNETGNIWTHLLGFGLMAYLMIKSWGSLHEKADFYDHLIFSLYFLSAIKCLLFSTLFHIHYCQSEEAYVKYGCLDFAGISMLICGSFSIVTYYSFYCDDFFRTMYIGKIVLLASIGVVGPMFPAWRTNSFRWWRVLVYLASGVFSAMPIFHYLLYHQLPSNMDFGWLGWPTVALSYIGGAVIYASKWPERLAPGKFDIILHSHQVWHVLVVFAAVLQYRNCLKLLEWRINTVCPIS